MADSIFEPAIREGCHAPSQAMIDCAVRQQGTALTWIIERAIKKENIEGTEYAQTWLEDRKDEAREIILDEWEKCGQPESLAEFRQMNAE